MKNRGKQKATIAQALKRVKVICKDVLSAPYVTERGDKMQRDVPCAHTEIHGVDLRALTSIIQCANQGVPGKISFSQWEETEDKRDKTEPM